MVSVQLENLLEKEDRECVRWLYDHDLIGFECIADLIESGQGKLDKPEEFEAKKTYSRWVQCAIKTLADSDTITLDTLTSQDLKEGLDTLRLAFLYGQEYRSNILVTSDVDFEGHFVTNPTLLYTVLYNFMKNARRQRPRSYKISVFVSEYEGELPETAYSPSATPKEGHFIKISVSDNGKGFGERDLSSLFDRPESRISGGFGLYYAAKVCDVLGCHIAIDSSRKGSTVTLYHPIR